MEQINKWLNTIDSFIWGWPLMVLLVGTGLYLSLLMGFVQFRGFIHGIKVILGKYDDPDHPGEINHFQALSAALSATIGNGNIVGVAGAILLGGPGAIFWMWVTALVGMATKFTSCTLAVRYRKFDEKGEAFGGPMYFIELGLGPRFKWLAVLFALFTAIASFGIGNMFQINSVAVSLNALVFGPGSDMSLGFALAIGIVFAVLTGLVIIGGIKSIGRVASYLVPFMCVLYMLGGLTILVLNITDVPAAFGTILHFAFSKPEALAGGLFGTVIRQGVARGLFSNEAGLGSAAMAHGAARTDEPVREGLVAMLGPFIDTIVICSITGLAIVVTGVHTQLDVAKAELTGLAFETGLNTPLGGRFVLLAIVFFAFSTLITWSYYGNRAVAYLFGPKAVLPYQMIYLVFIVIGACVTIEEVIVFCDAANGLMAIPNLIALLLLSPVVLKLSKEYFARMRDRDA